MSSPSSLKHFPTRLSAITCLAFQLAACVPNGSELAATSWGPPPTISAQSANAIITNQLLVLQYIQENARIAIRGPVDPNWKLVAQWGFNIGRSDCSIYMAELFRLARERQRNNGLLLDLSGAATAIVTATAPQSRALSIIAPAFGLAGNINDKLLNTYLFSEAPGIVSRKIDDAQLKYQQIMSAQTIDTSAAAYDAIQGYYNLCLPQSIEGMLLDTIANSDVVADHPGGTKPSSPKRVVFERRNASDVPPATASTPPRISLR